MSYAGECQAAFCCKESGLRFLCTGCLGRNPNPTVLPSRDLNLPCSAEYAPQPQVVYPIDSFPKRAPSTIPAPFRERGWWLMADPLTSSVKWRGARNLPPGVRSLESGFPFSHSQQSRVGVFVFFLFVLYSQFLSHQSSHTRGDSSAHSVSDRTP